VFAHPAGPDITGVVFPRPVAGAVTDVTVMARVVALCAVATTSVGAELACAAELSPFTGLDLAGQVLDLPGDTVPALLGGCMSIPVDVALAVRGAVLLNRAGRVGVVASPGRVVQPAGRVYALAASGAGDWVSGWWPRTVKITMPLT
jgi:hypothetical protein